DGAEPRSPAAAEAALEAAMEAAVEAVIRAQAEAGLEPITDGRLGDRDPERFADWQPGTAVRNWSFAARLTTRAVKQVLPGPYSLGGRLTGGAGDARVAPSGPIRARRRRVLASAETLRAE